jgi:hypothetical protein
MDMNKRPVPYGILLMLISNSTQSYRKMAIHLPMISHISLSIPDSDLRVADGSLEGNIIAVS